MSDGPVNTTSVRAEAIEPHVSDSAVQRRAEGLMLDALQQQLDAPLKRPFHFPVNNTSRMEFDGGLLPDDTTPGILVEAWAHQGPPKSAQLKKIVTDAFKLTFAATLIPVRPRLVLLFSDEMAAAPFRSERSWAAAAFRTYNVELVVIELAAEERAAIASAQSKQYR